MKTEPVIIVITRINPEINGENDEFVNEFDFSSDQNNYPQEVNKTNIIFLHGCKFKIENIDREKTAKAIKEEVDSWDLGVKEPYLLFHITSRVTEMHKALEETFKLSRMNIQNYSSENDWKYEIVAKIAQKIQNGESLDVNELIRQLFPDPELEASIHLWKSLTFLGLKIDRELVNTEDEFKEEINSIRDNEKIKKEKKVADKLEEFENINKFDDKMKDLYQEIFPNSI